MSRFDFDVRPTYIAEAVAGSQAEQEGNGDIKNESAMSKKSVQALLKGDSIMGVGATIMTLVTGDYADRRVSVQVILGSKPGLLNPARKLPSTETTVAKSIEQHLMNDRKAHGVPPWSILDKRADILDQKVSKGHRMPSEQHGARVLDGALPRTRQVKQILKWQKPAAATNRAPRLLPTRNDIGSDSDSGSLASSLAAQHYKSR